MNRRAQKVIGLAVPLLVGLAYTAPALAQFEEADTLPRFDAGVVGDLIFRGTRGVTVSGVEVSFTNSPAGGLRLDYRITQTLTLGVMGSYTRAKEKTKAPGGQSLVTGATFTVLQFGGELMLRVKPRIPGYFILGGGVQYVDPEADEPGNQLTGTESFTEGFGIAGAGYEFASTRRRAFRINFRLYLLKPAEQGAYDAKSIEIDFVLGAAFILRF